MKNRNHDVLVLTRQLRDGLGADDLVEDLSLDPERRTGPGHAGADTGASDRPEHRGGLAAGQPPELLDCRDDADGGVLSVESGHEKEPVVGSCLGCVDGRLALRVVKGDGDDHSGQHDHIDQRENRKLLNV